MNLNRSGFFSEIGIRNMLGIPVAYTACGCLPFMDKVPPLPLPTLKKFGGFGGRGGRAFRVYFFTLSKLGNVKTVVSLA